jgi:hypothetical protein
MFVEKGLSLSLLVLRVRLYDHLLHVFRYLSPKRAEALFKAVLELIGSEPPDEHRGLRISYRQVAHLRRMLKDQKNESLSRELFINLGNLTWIDEETGIGTTLIDQLC